MVAEFVRGIMEVEIACLAVREDVSTTYSASSTVYFYRHSESDHKQQAPTTALRTCSSYATGIFSRLNLAIQ